MSENPVFLIPVAIIGFVIFFSALWSFIAFLSSRLWGWHEIAQHYAGEIYPDEIREQFNWRSGRFG